MVGASRRAHVDRVPASPYWRPRGFMGSRPVSAIDSPAAKSRASHVVPERGMPVTSTALFPTRCVAMAVLTFPGVGHSWTVLVRRPRQSGCLHSMVVEACHAGIRLVTGPDPRARSILRVMRSRSQRHGCSLPCRTAHESRLVRVYSARGIASVLTYETHSSRRSTWAWLSWVEGLLHVGTISRGCGGLWVVGQNEGAGTQPVEHADQVEA